MDDGNGELTEEEQGSLSSKVIVLVVDLPANVIAGESELPSETTRPDDDGDGGDDGEAQPTTSLATEPAGVEDEETDEESTNDSSSTFQSGNDSTRGSIEFTSVDGSLISVEVVGSEEHWEEGYTTRAGKLGPMWRIVGLHTPRIRQSFNRSNRPLSSWGIEDWSSTLTMVPSGRTT